MIKNEVLIRMEKNERVLFYGCSQLVLNIT